jgi:lipoprotein-anchoring transpeptidase ErfK/SrfK
MRQLLSAGAMAALFVVSTASHYAKAEIVVRISRATQTMEVTVDGVPRYTWPVSTGRRSLPTPGGVYHPQSLHRSWFSSRYHNSPMPHSIFFRGGVAIHGTYETAWLGRPVSHGCVRLDPANATELFGLVRQEGMGATTIVVH